MLEERSNMRVLTTDDNAIFGDGLRKLDPAPSVTDGGTATRLWDVSERMAALPQLVR
jgi:hypothetical protein